MTKSVLNLIDEIDRLELSTPEELRKQKLLRELSDYHTPKLLKRLSQAVIDYRFPKRDREVMNFIGPCFYYE